MVTDMTVYIPITRETKMFLEYIKGTLKWVTVNNEKLNPRNMDKSHIINCMGLLNRGGGGVNVVKQESRKNWIRIFTHELFIREFTQ